jgi:hypothetical protein
MDRLTPGREFGRDPLRDERAETGREFRLESDFERIEDALEGLTRFVEDVGRGRSVGVWLG